MDKYITEIFWKQWHKQIQIETHLNLVKLFKNIQQKKISGRLIVKMLSYQYSDSHYKDTTLVRSSYLPVWDSHYKDITVSRPSYIHNGITHAWKNSLYIEMGPCIRWSDILTGW